MANDIPFAAGSRVVFYARDSGGRDQNLSIPQQEQKAREWCQEHEIIMTRIFMDVARSGTTTTGRDQFIAMCDYLGSKVPEKGVIFWEYARVARDYDDAMFFLADWRRRGYVVYSLTDSVPEGAMGKVFESLIAWKNDAYSRDLSKNVKRGLHYAANQNHASMGRPPVGYRNAKVELEGKRRDGSPHVISRLEIDEATAPLVKKAFAMRANGATFREIDAEVGLYSWLAQYHKFFLNPIYVGIRTFTDQKTKERTEIVGFCEPIVDRKTWDSAQVVNHARRDKFGYDHPRAVRSRFCLTGLLFCGYCGSPMCSQVTQQKGRPEYLYYRCGTTNGKINKCESGLIPKDEIEYRVWRVARTIYLSPSAIPDYYDKIIATTPDEQPAYRAMIQHAQNELATIQKEIQNILREIREGGSSKALRADLDRLEEEKSGKEGRLAQLEANPPKPLPEKSTLEIKRGEIAKLLENSTDGKLGPILRLAINKVVVWRPKGRRQEFTGQVTCRIPLEGVYKTFDVPL